MAVFHGLPRDGALHSLTQFAIGDGIRREDLSVAASGPPSWHVPRARQVMEPNQVDVIAAPVFGDLQQILHALEARFTGQIVGDIGDADRRYRIHNDVAFVHLVTITHLDMGPRPDANAASDSSAPDSLAKAFCEHHDSLVGHMQDLSAPEDDRAQRDGRSVSWLVEGPFSFGHG